MGAVLDATIEVPLHLVGTTFDVVPGDRDDGRGDPPFGLAALAGFGALRRRARKAA